MTDYNSIVQTFFSAYDAHDVAAMVGLCASDARGRYVPYGREAVMPVRGGIEQIWAGFGQAVPDFSAEIVEVIPAQGNIVVVQAVLGGTMPTDVPGIVGKGEFAHFAHAFIFRFNEDGKICYLDCYWDNSATSFLKASAL